MMKTQLAVLGLALAMATPVLALDLVPVGQAGDWAILTDPNHGDNCLTQATMSDGTFVRIGFREKGKEGIIEAFNPAWGEMKLGKKHPVDIKLGADSYAGKAEKKQLDGAQGLEVYFDNSQFAVDFAEATAMEVWADGAQLATVGLKGSKDAIEALLVCQEAVKG